MIRGLAEHVKGVAVHKFWVGRNLAAFITDEVLDACDPTRDDELRPGLYAELVWRGLIHDWSKYHPDEATAFARTSSKLKSTTYGSPEYGELLRVIRPAIQRHYSRHRHHPEHFASGVREMSEVDLIEMVADWGAAVRRHADGSLDSSMETNIERFELTSEDVAFIREVMGRMRLR